MTDMLDYKSSPVIFLGGENMANAPKIDISQILNLIKQLQQQLEQLSLNGLTSSSAKAQTALKTILREAERAARNMPGNEATSSQLKSYYNDMKRLSNLADRFSQLKLEIDDTEVIQANEKLTQLADKAEKAKLALENARASVPKIGETGRGGKAQNDKAKQYNKDIATIVNDGGGRAAAYEKKRETVADIKKNMSNITNNIIKSGGTAEDAKKTKDYQLWANLLKDIESSYKNISDAVAKVKITSEKAIAAEDIKEQALKKQTAALQEEANVAEQARRELEKHAQAIEEDTAKAFKNKEAQEKATSQMEGFSARVKQLTGAYAVFNLMRRAIRDIVQDFKQLDVQFNDIAIVTGQTTAQMWKTFGQVNKIAQQYGVTSTNVLEVQNLYYHQGKSVAEVNKLTAQTLTLAKIAGMDYGKATNQLTAALNAYRMSADEANKVTDVTSALAAGAATDTQELLGALTKTASIAASAGMSLENTEIFLTKMIESTREAPENLGTALKTVVARFGEVKQEIDGEEIGLVDINKVDTALKTVGISLLDTAGQIRDLDTVFMELSSIWDGLDRNTQRYIATIAAGSRQQSRFIAMMSNYDRTLELVEIAQNSAGTGVRQMATSMESLQSSINKLSSSWQEMYSNAIKSSWIGSFINGVNKVVSALNVLPSAFGLVDALVGAYIIKIALLNPILTRLTIVWQVLNGVEAEEARIKAKLNKEQLFQNTLYNKVNTWLKKTIAHKLGIVAADKLEKKAIEDNTKAQILNDAANKKSITFKRGNKIYTLVSAAATETDSKSKGKNTIVTKINTLAEKDNALAKLLKIAIEHPLAAIIAVVTAATILATAKTILNTKATKDNVNQLRDSTDNQNKYNDTLKEYNSLKNNIEIEEKYRNQLILTEEEREKEQNAIQEIINSYPYLLDYIDNEGNYHLKNTETVEAELKAKESLLRTNQALAESSQINLAKSGVYNDTSTKAGATMKQLVDFASNFDESALETWTDRVGGGINSDYLSKMFELYKTGEKTSFSAKDFSRLFAGQMSQEQWSVLLENIGSGEAKFDTTENITKALQESAGYSASQATKAAEAFTNLDNNSGKLFSTLITAAADFGQDITVQTAEIAIATANLSYGLSSNTTQAVKNATKEKTIPTQDFYQYGYKEDFIYTDNRYLKPAQLQKRATQYTDPNTGKLDETAFRTDLRQDYGLGADDVLNNSELKEREDTIVEAAKLYLKSTADTLVGSLESLTPEQYSKIESGITEYGGEKYSANPNATRDYISQLIAGMNIPAEDKENLITIFTQELEDVYGEIYSNKGLKSVLDKKINQFTNDQLKLISNNLGKIKNLAPDSADSDAFVKHYYNSISNSLNSMDLPEGVDRKSIFNTMLSIDPTNVESIATLSTKLQGLGLTLDQIQLISGSIIDSIDTANVEMSTTEDMVNTMDANMKKLTSDLALVTKGINGTLSAAEYTEVITQLQTMGISMEQLKNETFASADGFALSDQMMKIYSQGLYETAHKANILRLQAIRMRQELLKGTMADYDANSYKYKDAEAQLLELQYQEQIITMTDVQQKAAATATYTKAIAEKTGSASDKAKDYADKLKEAADAAKQLVSALKEYLSYLEGIDTLSNIDKVIESYENLFSDLEFEISFSTNTNVIKQDLEKLFNNLNVQVAQDRAAAEIADRDANIYANLISGYGSFGTEGEFFLDLEAMDQLQQKIRDLNATTSDGDHALAEVYKQQYDNITNNVKAYETARKKVGDYTKELQQDMKAIDDYYDKLNDNVVSLQDKLIESFEAIEKRDLELLEETYNAKIKAQDNYLNAVQEAVNKERKIREQRRSEEELQLNEKKLTLLQMDSSGVYAREIASLQAEIRDQTRDITDAAVDDYIQQMSDRNEASQEAMQSELEYRKAYMDTQEAREARAVAANKAISEGYNACISVLQSADEKYASYTAEKQLQLRQEWDKTITNGIAGNAALQSSVSMVGTQIDLAKSSEEGFAQAVSVYSQNMVADNGAVQGSVEAIKTSYVSLASYLPDVTTAQNNLTQAMKDYASAAGVAETAANKAKTAADSAAKSINYVNTLNSVKAQGSEFPLKVTTVDKTAYIQKGGNWYKFKDYDATSGTIHSGAQQYNSEVGDRTTYTIKTEEELDKEIERWRKNKVAFAKGGLVDYTGPAWVDGTKTNPEAFLSAADTSNIAALTKVLSTVIAPISDQNLNSVQNAEQNIYEIHIEVDNISNDYDVDDMVNRVTQRIATASKSYGRVTQISTKR